MYTVHWPYTYCVLYVWVQTSCVQAVWLCVPGGGSVWAELPVPHLLHLRLRHARPLSRPAQPRLRHRARSGHWHLHCVSSSFLLLTTESSFHPLAYRIYLLICTFLILISNFVSLDPCVYSTYTVRKGSADLAVCDWWRYCIALCDVKFSQIEGNGRKFRHIELSNKKISRNLLCMFIWGQVQFLGPKKGRKFRDTVPLSPVCNIIFLFKLLKRSRHC